MVSTSLRAGGLPNVERLNSTHATPVQVSETSLSADSVFCYRRRRRLLEIMNSSPVATDNVEQAVRSRAVVSVPRHGLARLEME